MEQGCTAFCECSCSRDLRIFRGVKTDQSKTPRGHPPDVQPLELVTLSITIKAKKQEELSSVLHHMQIHIQRACSH